MGLVDISCLLWSLSVVQEEPRCQLNCFSEAPALLHLNLDGGGPCLTLLPMPNSPPSQFLWFPSLVPGPAVCLQPMAVLGKQQVKKDFDLSTFGFLGFFCTFMGKREIQCSSAWALFTYNSLSNFPPHQGNLGYS